MEHFVSCDWGSSSFRLRLVDSRGICGEVASGQGATELVKNQSEDAETTARSSAFSSYLRDMLARLRDEADSPLGDCPIVVSGMVTSAHGWKELPYARAPVPIDGNSLVFDAEEFEDDRGRSHPLFFVSGVRTAGDVMRGEECEIIGLLHTPELEQFQFGARVLMPGTHSKHVIIQNGTLEHFQTYMTGELYSVLGRHSVLNHTVESSGGIPTEGTPFTAGVEMGEGRGLSAGLFTVRTNGLFEKYSPPENAAFLSGLLIGAELQDVDAENDDRPLVLCGGTSLREPYMEALRVMGNTGVTCVPAEMVDTLSAVGHRVFLRSQGVI